MAAWTPGKISSYGVLHALQGSGARDNPPVPPSYSAGSRRQGREGHTGVTQALVKGGVFWYNLPFVSTSPYFFLLPVSPSQDGGNSNTVTAGNSNHS